MVDFPSHALWAYALFRNQTDWPAYVLFTLVPDLAFFTPALLLLVKDGRARKELWRLRKLPHETAGKLPYFKQVRSAYRMSHSWVVLAIVTLLAYFVEPSIAKPLALGVFLHLALDLFTHKHSLAGQRPFYPLSQWEVEGFLHWRETRFLTLNYGLLVIVYTLIWLG